MFLQITPRLGIDDSELEESFIAASGPGGQNVNKVATAVQLRFNLAKNDDIAGWREGQDAGAGRAPPEQ